MSRIHTTKFRSAHNRPDKARDKLILFVKTMHQITDAAISSIDMGFDHNGQYTQSPCIGSAICNLQSHFKAGGHAVHIYMRFGERSLRTLAYFSDSNALFTAQSPDGTVKDDKIELALRQLHQRRILQVSLKACLKAMRLA